MSFELPKISYSGKILEVTLGVGDNAIKVGGETCYPFHFFEGQKNKPSILAMEVWDTVPEDWPIFCLEPVTDVITDVGLWAKKCVKQFGAEAIVVQLKSTDPNGLNAPPEKASQAVAKVLATVNVPIIVWGSANSNKDAATLKYIAEEFQGKNLLLGPVVEDNYKVVGAAALAYKHSIIASSPIDVNLAKQLNILLNNLGIPLERLVIDPTTGGLGYGLEYSYSVMERIRMAALIQADDKLMLPIINNIGNEVWKSKEAKLDNKDTSNLGDGFIRGVLMEAIAAISFLMSGSNILILRHPKTLHLIKNFINQLSKTKKVVIPETKIKRSKASKIIDFSKVIVEKAKAESEAKVIVEKAKAESEAKVIAEKAKAESEAKVIAEKAKAEAELAALRIKRAEERACRIKTICTSSTFIYKKNEGNVQAYESGTAGPNAIYIYRILTRWSLRGFGYIK